MKSRGLVERRIDALPAAVAFVERSLAVSSLDNDRRQVVHLAVEELLTNMIKYAPQGAPTIAVEIACHEGAVDVTLIDTGVECFDPTKAPAAEIDRPIDQRRPGGLGLHLVARLVDSLSYRYVVERREGTTRFRVAQPPRMLTIERGAGDAVRIVGRFDAAQAPAAQAAFDALHGVITVDCSDLDYVSSAGLGVLLKTQKRLLATGGRLRLSGLKPHIRDIFVYSGFDQLFEIVGDGASDRSNFSSGRP